MSLRCLMLVVVFITEAASGVDVMKVVGDEVSFRPDKPLPPSVSSFIWKHRNSDGVVVKAIEWDNEDGLMPNLRFQGITPLDVKTGQITITKLTVEHSGVYTIDINSKQQETNFTLTVKERVPKPVIDTEKSDINPDVVYLICKYSEPIIWKNSAGETLTGLPFLPKGESITVVKKGNLENFYTCTLDNGVSKETSDPVYERDLFKEGLNWKFAIWMAIVLICMVFIILFLFIPPLYSYCSLRQKTSRK